MTAMHLARDPAASTALLRRINSVENQPGNPLGLRRLRGTTWIDEMHEVVAYFAGGGFGRI
jgi:hypothetical protein